MRRPRRRGFVIVAVLIAGMSGLWIATSLLYLMQSDVRAAAITLSRTQHRSLGLSGLRMLADVLVEQRSVLLAGEIPQIQEQYSLWDEGDREAVVRLLPVGPDGARLVSEAGRIDLNHATVEMLSELPMLTMGQAQAIISTREALPSRRFSSLHELLGVEGLDVVDLFGELSEEKSMDQALGEQGDLGERIEARLTGGTPRGLMDVLTVHGFEPNLQQSGRRRIDLNVPWSDELGKRIEERFGEGAARALEQVFKETTFNEDAQIVRILKMFEVPIEEWSDPLDALTTVPDVHVAGRLDLNSASADALEALPGIDRSTADRLVAERESLDDLERASVAWPLTRDILTPEDYEVLASLLTVRSWTWRVRIAAGTVSADDPEGAIDQAVVYEAVIDLADPRPRLGYLREITMLQTASRLASALEWERAEEVEAVDPVAGFDDDLGQAGSVAGIDLLEMDDLTSPKDELEEQESPFPSEQEEEMERNPPPGESAGTGRVGRWIP